MAAKLGFAVEMDNSCDDWDYEPARSTCSAVSTSYGRSVTGVLNSGGEVTSRSRMEEWVGATSNLRWPAQKKSGERILPCSARELMALTATVRRLARGRWHYDGARRSSRPRCRWRTGAL